MQEGSKRNPEQSAEVLDIQRKTGLPADFIERNLEPIKQKSIQYDADRLKKTSPVTSQWVAESPYHASVAKDDLENLSTTERLIKTVTAMPRAFVAGITSFSPALYGVLEEAAALPLVGTDPRTRETIHQFRKGAEGFTDTVRGDRKGLGFTEKAALSGVESMGQSLTGMVASVLTGNPEIMLGMMGGQTAGQSFGEALDKGVDPTQALSYGLSQGAVEVATESIPALWLLRDVGLKRSLFKTVSNQLMAEVPGEQVATLLQDFNDWAVLNPDKPFSSYIEARPSAAAETLIATIVATAGQSGIAHGAGKLADRERVQNQRDFFLALGDASQKSKLRERLPEAYQGVLERLTENGPIENVYIPVESWKTYWQGKGADPKAIAGEVLGETKSYDEAILSGEDIVIPTAKYARKIAAVPEHNAFFVEELRTDPLEMNARESRELMDKMSEALDTEAAPVEEEKPKSIIDTITEQLKATGRYNEEASKTMASIFEGFNVLGSRAGIDPMELFKSIGLQITNGEEGALRGKGIPEAGEGINASVNGTVEGKDSLSSWETEGGFIPGLVTENGLDLTEQIKTLFGPEAAGIVKGIFIPKRPVINPDGSLNLTKSQKSSLEFVRSEVEAEEAGFRHFREGDTGGDMVVTAVPSSFPEYFKNKGYTKAETLKAIDKALAGEKLGKRQMSIVQDLNQSYRLQAADELKRMRAERPEVTDKWDMTKEQIDALSDEEFTRVFFQGANNAQIDAVFAKVAGDIWTGRHMPTRPLPVSHTPDVLKELGAKDRLVTITPEVIRKAGKGKHGLPFEAIEKLPSMLRDPLMVFKSATVPNSLVLLTGMEHEGKPIIAAIHLEQVEGREIVNKVASVHDKELSEIRNFLERGLLQYWDEEKAKGWLQSAGLWSTREGVIPSDKNILSKTDLVKKKVFDQSANEDARGRISFGPQGVNISLFKNADLSTFLHETGHLYLEVMGDLAEAENTPQDIKDDYKAVLEWLGVKSRAEIKTEHHEQWARGFEAYLMEGKTPSSKLRAAFAKFRAWLIQVYKNLRSLNVELTPEVRDVMDRLLATQEEIEAAQTEQGMFPLFKDPKTVGMSEEDATRYSEAISEARQASEEVLASKLMEAVNREQRAQWKEERAKVYEEVKNEVDSQPVYLALSVLQSNKGNLPEGVEPVKLSKKIIIEQFGGEERLKSLPKPHVYSVEGGIHPDEAAEMFGFSSGDELLTAMEHAEGRFARINRITDERMKETHTDPMTDGQLPEEAMKAVHNEHRAKLLRMELEYLTRERFKDFKDMAKRISKRVPSNEALRAHAQGVIARKQVRYINPQVLQRAEAKAAKKAVEAFYKGDLDLAFHMKLQEAISHEVYRAAVEAKEDIDKRLEYVRKFEKDSVREKIGKAGGDFLEQIDAILEGYSFKWTSIKKAERLKSLSEWVDDQEKQGLSVTVPKDLLEKARLKNYWHATYEELIGITDAIKNIEHLARLKNKLLASEHQREVEEVKGEIIASIEANHKTDPEPLDFAPGLGKRLIKGVKEGIAEHTKMEFLFEFLDGNKAGGAVWQALFKPFVTADNEKSRMSNEVSENMRRIFGAYSRKERAAWFLKKTYIPEIKTSLNKANMLAVALNQGNAYNRTAVMEGYNWDAADVQAILDHLDKRDWDMVQAVWDFIDTYWPAIEKMEKDISGLAPEKVKAEAVNTKFGAYKGGYYPIIFDREMSWRQNELSEQEWVKEIFGGKFGRAMTKHGHTIERTNTGGKPISLQLSGLTGHLENVIHDLAYRRVIIDTWKLANSETVRQAIIGAAGREMYAQINPWIRAIAGDRRSESFNKLEKILGHARHGATIVNMGLKLTTALVQPLGYTISIKELGAKYGAIGLKDFYANPLKIGKKWDFVTERSSFMRDRMKTFDRDVRDTLRGIGVMGKQGVGTAVDLYTAEVESSYFSLIGYMDMAVSIPTWLGAYHKAMDGAVENIEKGDEKAAVDYADRTVRVSQSSGQAKDLAAIQRGSETFKLFTMFYSYFSMLFNQFGKTYSDFRMSRNVPKLVASLFLIWFAPAVLEDLLLGRGPDSDDDDEKWAMWLAGKIISYPMQSVILLRDIVNGISKYGYEPSAAFDMFERMGKAGTLGIDLATGEKEEAERADVKNIAMLTGYFAQLPARQLWLTGEYLYDWMIGEVQPESPVEAAWRGLVTGKKK